MAKNQLYFTKYNYTKREAKKQNILLYPYLRNMFLNFRQYLAANAEFTSDELDRICSLSIYKKLQRHEIPLNEGETARHMIFISKGLLRLFRRDEKGREFILKFSSENRWLTDRESYRYERPSKANIEALENCEILLWKKDDFELLLLQIPAFKHMMKELSAKNQAAVQARLYSTMAATAEEKYLQFSEKHPALLNRVPLHMVASYLGLSRETLSRIRKHAVQKSI